VEGHLQHDGHRTWYRVVGELDSGVPVAPWSFVTGPGATHDYVAPIAEQLHRSGRACVLYDQLGNGRSDHLPDVDPSFWTVERFERELAALVAHLGIAGRYHVVGQSWGGMLALLHALERPPGLISVVAADSPASIPAFVAGCNELAMHKRLRHGERVLSRTQAHAPHRGARALLGGGGGVPAAVRGLAARRTASSKRSGPGWRDRGRSSSAGVSYRKDGHQGGSWPHK